MECTGLCNFLSRLFKSDKTRRRYPLVGWLVGRLVGWLVGRLVGLYGSCVPNACNLQRVATLQLCRGSVLLRCRGAARNISLCEIRSTRLTEDVSLIPDFYYENVLGTRGVIARTYRARNNARVCIHRVFAISRNFGLRGIGGSLSVACSRSMCPLPLILLRVPYLHDDEYDNVPTLRR